MRSTMFCFFSSPSWCERNTRAQSIGVNVSEINADITMVMAMVTANSRNTRPTIPPISRIGMNTAISENVIDMMVNPISREPLSAAS